MERVTCPSSTENVMQLCSSLRVLTPFLIQMVGGSLKKSARFQALLCPHINLRPQHCQDWNTLAPELTLTPPLLNKFFTMPSLMKQLLFKIYAIFKMPFAEGLLENKSLNLQKSCKGIWWFSVAQLCSSRAAQELLASYYKCVLSFNQNMHWNNSSQPPLFLYIWIYFISS